MKKIFIYYSLTNNTSFVAKYFEEEGITTKRIISKTKIPMFFPLRILVGGFLAGISYKAKILKLDINYDKYNEIIIGSPVWNDNFPPQINTLLDDIDKSKKISFILTSGSGKAPKLIEKIKKTYPSAKTVILKGPFNSTDEVKKYL